GLTEVAAQEARHEAHVLDGQRPVEAELLADGIEVRLARAGLDEEDRGIAGHAHEEEDHHREEDQGEQGVPEAPDDVALHGFSASCATSGYTGRGVSRPA